MRSRIAHIGPGPLSLLEVLVLGPLAALLVLWAIPSLGGLEWQCFSTSGIQRVSGDTYLENAVVLGTFGWLLVAVAAIYAQIGDSRRMAVVLPIAWFVVFVTGAIFTALVLGPEACPA